MQVRKIAILLALVCLLPCLASAQESLRVSPSTITPGSESFLTIYVQGTLDTDVISVVYSGPGGTETVEPVARNENAITAWVPDTVAFTEGTYSVDVYVTRNNETFHFGPGYFTVAVPPPPDEEPLLLNAPEVVTAEADGGSAVVTWDVTSSDGTPVVCNPPSGSTFQLGVTFVTCVADNGVQQATAQFSVFVQDTTAPVLSLPADFTTDGPVVTYTVTATDTNDPDPDVFCFPASGTSFPSGTTTVQCFAVDNHANYGVGTFNVTVTGGAPQLTVPDDILAEATSAAGAVVTYTVTTTGTGVTIVCDPDSGATFAIGITTVTCTATNSFGSDSESFTVTVPDTTAPTLNLPGDIHVGPTSEAGAVVNYTATATDLVDGDVPVTCDPASGSTFPLGSTTVQCTASDAAGNTATGTFEVLVEDITPPTIVLVTPSISNLWPPDHKMVPITVTVVATDDLDPNPSVMIVSVSSNQPVNGTGDGDKAPDWDITGPLTVELRAERSNNQERIYTITVQATDAAGNTSTATCQVKVSQQPSSNQTTRRGRP